jgi:hypothetical protein
LADVTAFSLFKVINECNFDSTLSILSRKDQTYSSAVRFPCLILVLASVALRRGKFDKLIHLWTLHEAFRGNGRA